MSINDTIKDIRNKCRLAMNGVTSSTMREYGLNYKLNFGVSLPHIKKLAQDYKPDRCLAESLWKEDVRELKILATMLYPIDMFSEETACKWIEEIPNQEIREQITRNLLQNVVYAESLMLQLCASSNIDFRITGYWMLSRLLIVKKIEIADFNLSPYIYEDIQSCNITLKSSSLSALKNVGRTSEKTALKILNKLSTFPDTADKNEIYDILDFEFEFHFNKKLKP